MLHDVLAILLEVPQEAAGKLAVMPSVGLEEKINLKSFSPYLFRVWINCKTSAAFQQL